MQIDLIAGTIAAVVALWTATSARGQNVLPAVSQQDASDVSAASESGGKVVTFGARTSGSSSSGVKESYA